MIKNVDNIIENYPEIYVYVYVYGLGDLTWDIFSCLSVRHHIPSVDRAGLERTQVGESAPSRLEGGSTSAGADKV